MGSSTVPRSDLLLALALTVFAQLNLRFGIDESTHYGSTWAAAVAIAVATSVLALRRRAPLLTAAVVAVVIAGPELWGRLTITLWGHFVPMIIATYSVARHAPARRAWPGVALTFAALVVVFVRVPVIGTTANIPFNAVPFAAAVAAGRVLRRRQLTQDRDRDRAERLEAEREEVVRVAVADERARIARELHDIVAHSVSVMVVQAGAAEDLLDRDPAKARAPLRLVQETGRQAVGELARMLGLLRGERAGPRREPQPGVADLPYLVDAMCRAGLPVTLRTEGDPGAVPPGVGLAVYRVVQEALTNTFKHAMPAESTVTVRYGHDAVEVDVHDDGRRTVAARGTGHGLIGMRERVALYDGTVEAADRPEGGFAVRARLAFETPGPAVAG